MNVLMDYENAFCKNKSIWSKLCSGLFEQYDVELYMLCEGTRNNFEEIDRLLYSYGVRCAYVFTGDKTKSEVLKELREKGKMDIFIGPLYP